ncbi:MAG: aminotransferase class I/II-fold pyridoxal phosphate-dependent enzyme [Acidobacteriaceae bacterium]|nr:aminotransferase class I/II-fold pyridoxal phosphate-dependent enzyme [Acidobacteriaceae bacterium]
MKLTPFLLDQWLELKNTADPPIEYDLGSSTGPVWTMRELLALGGHDFESFLDTRLFYTSPAGSEELRNAIATLEGVDVSAVQVLTGAAEALLILFFLAAEAGANIVLPSPGFPTNAALPQGLRLETRYYKLRARDRFRIDLDEIRALVDDHTRFVFVNSPHNPTGRVLSDKEAEEIHDFCAARRVQIVFDQVYHPIYHGEPSRTAARLPHATVLGDFSKALCLSGLRVGWIIEHDPARRAEYLNARSYFTVSNSILNERLATFALAHRDVIYERARRTTQKNLALLDPVLSGNDFIGWVRPQGGMTGFPWLVDGTNAREFCRDLAKRGVLLAPGDCFDMPSHFRIGFGTSGDRFPLALERFSEFLASYVAA